MKPVVHSYRGKMLNNIHFVSVEIPNVITKKDLEKEFPGLVLTTIEKSMVGEISNEKYIFVATFGIITFCNFTNDEISSFLSRLNIREANSYATALINQDYLMLIDGDCSAPRIDDKTIRYSKFDKSIASIISLALSQSVGLEISENSLEKMMEKSVRIYEKLETLRVKDRKSLMDFAAVIAKERFHILNKLYLLDKPDIIWDDVELESLYNQLSFQLDLKSRFEVVEHKISYLKESVDFAIDKVNQKSSEYLEWIIIWLIVIEVIFSIYAYVIKPFLS